MTSLALSSWKNWVFKTSQQHLDTSSTTTTIKKKKKKKHLPIFQKDFTRGEVWNQHLRCSLCTICGTVVEVVKLSVTCPALLLSLQFQELAKLCCSTSSTRNTEIQESSCSRIKRSKAITAMQNLWCWFSVQGIHYLALHNNTFPIPTCCCNHSLVYHSFSAQSLGKDVYEIIRLSSHA